MKSIKLSDFTKDEYIIAAARASSPARLEELLRIAAVLDSDPHKTIINPTSLQETLQNLYDKKNFAMQQEVALAVQALNISSQINYARTDFDNAKP